MADTTDNLSLTDEQKTRLLRVGLEPVAPPDEPNMDEARGDLLCDILRQSLPIAPHEPQTASHTYHQLQSALGPSLGQLLTNPETDIATLRQIKEYAKTLGKQAQSDTESNVSLAVYFAAIASTLVFCGQCITEHKARDLTRFFNHFALVAWMRADLRELFVKAADAVNRGNQQE